MDDNCDKPEHLNKTVVGAENIGLILLYCQYLQYVYRCAVIIFFDRPICGFVPHVDNKQ